MKTPKEQASELIIDMLRWQPMTTDEAEEARYVERAKQCALIAVKAVVKNMDSIHVSGLKDWKDYWESVEAEIKKR